jgi:hypothetical protein
MVFEKTMQKDWIPACAGMTDEEPKKWGNSCSFLIENPPWVLVS